MQWVVDMKRLKKIGWLALVLSLMAVLLTGAAGCGTEVATKVNFLRDWEAAKEQAASESKPIMVNFYTKT
jgi:hypothetical protein